VKEKREKYRKKTKGAKESAK